MPSQALEQMLISVPRMGQDKTYQTIDTYAAGTIALYSGKPIKPAKDFGIGPGIAREMPGAGGLIERFRYDDHKPLGPHLNYEIVVPGINRKPVIDNHHIPGIPKPKL